MSANTHIEGTEIVKDSGGNPWLKTTIPQAGYCASWLLNYETTPPPPPAGTLPTITGSVAATLKAPGYPDKVVTVDIGEWKPNA
jgi:hypothetical protein